MKYLVFMQLFVNKTTFFLVVIFFIASAVFNKTVAIVSSFYSAIYGPFIGGYMELTGPNLLMREGLATLMLALLILFVMSYIKRQSFKNMAFIGIFLGLSWLTHGTLIVFVPCFLMWLFYFKRFVVQK